MELDGLASGVLRRLLRSSPLVRQAIFAAIAHTMDRNEQEAELLAQALCVGRARHVLDSAIGGVPDGLMGALERIGSTPLPRADHYKALVALFASPEKRDRTRCLQHCGEITSLTIDAVTHFDPKWLHPNVLRGATSLRDLSDFLEALRLLQSLPNGPSDEAVHRAIANMHGRARLQNVIARLMRRSAAYPEHPLDADADFRPLRTASDLIRAGRRFRNCLRHHVLGALTGRTAYAVFREQAVLEFRRLQTGGWLLFEVHGPENDRVPRDVRAVIREACAARSLPMMTASHDPDWEPLVRMATEGGIYDWAA
ncbi:hypothetical protein [Phenylobacterium sp. J367]|uniref:hypothetical protein n=1 Tax=Phenylobacterium sp. J367 TaxID=2898435 RepID=UPI0021515194|nr:hypothetical protein [Phenylobacterium sp. J367]MCR5879872.1 hypothetical protein [Phenylobacterium sp. J367]